VPGSSRSRLRQLLVVDSGSAGVSGSLSAVESGDDSFASSGDVFINGSLAATESGADSFAGAGKVVVTGTLAATESGEDTFASSGTVGAAAVTGTLAATETGADTFASDGDVIVKGALAATEAGADTFASAGDVFVQGALNATESGADTFAAAGDVFVIGALAAVESGADTMAGSGVVLITGALAATEEGDDTFYATGGDIVEPEVPSGGSGFVIVDFEPKLWWKRKPKAMPVEEAKRKVARIAGTIERIASKQGPASPATRKEIAKAIAPQLAEMPGFDWTVIYQTVLLGLHIRQQESERARFEAEQFALMRIDEDDLLVLLLAA
jgi:hypothetical protein